MLITVRTNNEVILDESKCMGMSSIPLVGDTLIINGAEYSVKDRKFFFNTDTADLLDGQVFIESLVLLVEPKA